MVAQVTAVIIFLVMFALIITDKIERQYVTLGCGLATLVLVFGVFMQDMKYQEVADDLHISINTVKTLLRNGIKHLRSHFSQHLELLIFYLQKATR